ncbi:MAG TPA: trypsin-like peptidase domain-containing protein, partial [Pyrinomonadaceae bacterium]|nr:trypsin-like peptidase domain-containing protein [Pyrinomonadaceae bacterium]
MNTKSNLNLKKAQIGQKTMLATLLAAVMAALVVGGSVRVGQYFPATVSADTTFAENALPGISDASTVSYEQNTIEVYKAAAPGVVLISSTGERSDPWGEREEQSGTGSGVVIDKSGNILTNEHVVRGAKNLTVNLGGDKVFPARVIGSDPDTDLAVIKIEAPADQLTVIPLGDSDALTVGQKVLAIGNPFGLDRTLTTGVISGLQRPIRARNGKPIEGAIQTDASINPGNSGGPLLDKFGRLIGVNSQILSPSGASNGIGFAIPVNIVKRIVPQLIQSGRIDRPKLGVGARGVAELIQQGVRMPVENGLLVVTVAAGSPAAKAGMTGTTQGYDGRVTLGDIITAADGQPVKTVDELYKVIDRHKIGETVQIEIWHGGEKRSLTIKLEALSNVEGD